MADVLLVHGSCHGAWCWRDLIPALTALGHAPHCIDLPGHSTGDTKTRTPASVTLGETCRAVADAAGPQTVILGHSWGGFPITGALAYMGAAPRGLIYLCAYVPELGQSLIDMRRAGPRQTIGAVARKAPDGHSYTLDPDQVAEMFYQDCPAEAVDFARRNLCAEPIRPQATPLNSAPGWAALPKAYIRCTEDRVIPPDYQAQMAARIATQVDLQASHSPFFSMPEELAETINRLIAQMP